MVWPLPSKTASNPGNGPIGRQPRPPVPILVARVRPAVAVGVEVEVRREFVPAAGTVATHRQPGIGKRRGIPGPVDRIAAAAEVVADGVELRQAADFDEAVRVGVVVDRPALVHREIELLPGGGVRTFRVGRRDRDDGQAAGNGPDRHVRPRSLRVGDQVPTRTQAGGHRRESQAVAVWILERPCRVDDHGRVAQLQRHVRQRSPRAGRIVVVKPHRVAKIGDGVARVVERAHGIGGAVHARRVPVAGLAQGVAAAELSRVREAGELRAGNARLGAPVGVGHDREPAARRRGPPAWSPRGFT